MDLARELAPDSHSSDSPAVNPDPVDKWHYPEGRPDHFEERPNPWTAWQAVQQRPQQPAVQRDPKAETDFWRDAARSISDDVSHKAPQQHSADDSTVHQQPPSGVWKMARDVTGEMVDLQSRLKQELEQYDPLAKTDQYRHIARDLVGPPPEPDDELNPIRESADLDKGAHAGGGWNPDVDWMRFDDVRRELRKQHEKERRIKAEQQARQNMEQQQPSADPAQPPKQTDSAPYTDQSNSEQLLTRDNMPRFLRNKFMRSATYGASWAGAEREINQLIQQGAPLRDPKADAEQWRSIARELNLDVESDIAHSGRQQQQSDTQSVLESAPSIQDPESDPLHAESVESVESDTDDDVTEASAWGSWRSGSATWERANEKVQSRDPKQEVDMWRASALELTSGVPSSAPTGDSAPNQANSTASGAQSSAWDTWRSANEQWESSLSEGTDSASSDSWSIASDSQSSDRDDSAGRKASSERSAWEQWDRVSGNIDTSRFQQWWESRTDTVQRASAKSARSNSSNIDQWRSMAQEISPTSEQSFSSGKESPDNSGSRQARLENDATVNPWKTIARDLTNELPSEEEG